MDRQESGRRRTGIVIGFSGKFGSGKDTAATILMEAYPEMQWKRISFAYRIKQIVADLTGTTIEQNESQEGKQIVPPGFKISLGTMQQRIGMSMRADLGDDVWVLAAFAKIGPDDNVLVTDVRFPNEMAEIHRRDGMVVRLVGHYARFDEKRDPAHISETALDGAEFDEVIDNTDTLAELRRHLVNIF